METSEPRLQHDLTRFVIREGLTLGEAHELEGISEYVSVPQGTALLTEGTPNTRLYFLISGRVDVMSRGEKITSLGRCGDLLGEMSLITFEPCSATIVASELSEVLAIDITKFSSLSADLHDRMSKALYRLFSVILAKKLYNTNEKARLFEITNRELVKAKEALEHASEKKIDELSSNQMGFMKRLATLHQDESAGIEEELKKIVPESELSKRVRRLLGELGALEKIHNTEHSLNEKKVLLAEHDIDEQINAKMSLGGTGVKFTVVSDLEEGKTALQNDHYDILCVNSQFVDLIPFCQANQKPGLDPTKFVFITSEQLAGHFKTLRTYPELSTILARHPDDRTFTVKNIATTIRKLSSQDIFGPEKYLSWGTEFKEERVTHSGQREELIERMMTHFESLGLRGVLLRRCSRVAEELLMNVIYDAPTDSDGKPLYNHVDRATPVTLTPEQQATFRYACDGTFLAIAVEDPFGGLTRTTVLDYLEKCFQGVDAEGKVEKGGGGNGLFQIIQSSSLVIFNVKPKRRTEVIALFNINIQVNKISIHPSFHFFEC